MSCHQVVAATAHFLDAIRSAPEDPSNYVQLMHALFLDDQRVQLATWMLRYEELFPERTNSHTFHFNLAMTLYGLYRRGEALERFVRSLAAPPPREKENMMFSGSEWQERAFHHIGMLLEKAGEPMHAARAYLTTMRLQSRDHPKYGVYLATALLSAGRLNEASALHRALLGMPGSRLPRLSRTISDFIVARAPHSISVFSPWLGVLHHALDAFPADSLALPKIEHVNAEEALWRSSSRVRMAMRQRILDAQYPGIPCHERQVLCHTLTT